MRDTAASMLAEYYIRLAMEERDPAGWEMTYAAAIIRDPDYDLRPALRVVTRHTSMPLTVELIDSLNESEVQKRMCTRHRLTHMIPTALLGLDDPDDIALWALDEPVVAVQLAIEVSCGFRKPTVAADVDIGKDPEAQLVEVVVITCSERPEGWPR